MKSVVILIISLIANLALANEPIKNGFTPEQEEWMAEQNATNYVEMKQGLVPPNVLPSFLTDTTVRAFAEFETAGYLIFSSDFNFSSEEAKRTMAKNLPDDMTLVVFTYNDFPAHIQIVKDNFSDVIDEDRLKVVYLPLAYRGFWARDGIPVPVWRKDKVTNEEMFTVVDAVYYHDFEADQEVSELFGAKLTAHDYYYEGGNFMANTKNECLVVNKQATAQMPDSIFKDHYGCEKLVRLPHIKGIGHADESVKFVNDTTVLTDAPSYKDILEDEGYEVLMLPRPNNEYETYVNSLEVNGVIYVPIFDQDTDEDALQVYRDLGYDKVIGINSEVLSNQGAGSLHCITMTYPNVPFQALLKNLGGVEL